VKLAIVVPVKSPRRAKHRLEAVLTEPDRERLATTMARDVFQIVAGLWDYGRLVISDDPDVLEEGRRFGLDPLIDRVSQGQSAAVQQGFAAAWERGYTAALTIPGDVPGVTATELEELCASLGADGVQFLPEMDRDALVAHLNAADCALLPSRFESFHLAALEALSCGVPVITSDRTGVGSWFDRATGMARLPIDDAGEFAERAATLLADGGWLEHAGRAAASRVRELFDPAATGAQILELHEELQAGFRPGSAGHWPDGARAGEMELHPLLDSGD